MNKKMKFLGLVVLVGLSVPNNLIAQTSLKKVGVITSTPTEVLDINGTLRIRSLPNNGAVNVISTTPSGGNAGTPTQTFTAVGSLVNDPNYNIVGSTTKAGMLTNNSITVAAGFNTTDASIAPFVIKRYSVGDWPSGIGDVGIATGMSVANWEAVMSNVGYVITTIDAINNVFGQTHLFGYTLRAGNDTATDWRIMGDINGIKDSSPYVDILFINKKIVFAVTSPLSRATYFPW